MSPLPLLLLCCRAHTRPPSVSVVSVIRDLPGAVSAIRSTRRPTATAIWSSECCGFNEILAVSFGARDEPKYDGIYARRTPMYVLETAARPQQHGRHGTAVNTHHPLLVHIRYETNRIYLSRFEDDGGNTRVITAIIRRVSNKERSMNFY